MRISDCSSHVCSSDLSAVDDALAEMEQRQATPFDPFDASLVYQPATKRIARSRAFRKAVVAAYGGRCAMCGGGATAPDGRSEIEEIGRASCRERVCQYV